MNDCIDSVALQPTIAERSGVSKRGVGWALGEPRVLPEQFFQQRHAIEILRQTGHRRSADMKAPAAIVVKFHRQMRRLPFRDHAFEPLLQREVFRR